MTGSHTARAGDIARTHPALTDGETGLANQLHFDLIYNYLFDAGDRGLAFTVMMVSVGEAGAPVEQIRRVGQQIQEVTRSSDLVSHLGHRRYIVLLLGTNASGARVAADRIEAALAEFTSGPISFGLAPFTHDVEDAQTLLRSADAALLAAQATGGGVQFA